MDIAIFGRNQRLRDNLENGLRACLGSNSTVSVRQYEMSPRDILNERPPKPSAVFLIIDNAYALADAESVVEWGEGYPMVMAASSPEYALDGIRKKVKYYVLFPVDEGELREALLRTGVILN